MSVLSLETAHLAGVYNNGFVGDSMVHTETKREYSNEFYVSVPSTIFCIAKLKGSICLLVK